MNRIFIALSFLALPLPAAAQSTTPPDPFQALKFLEETWEAKTPGDGGVKTSGIYTFRRELGGHVLARHSTSDPGCKAPAAFDCEHGDLLYVYEDAPGQPLKAIYFDNEGHVIHYSVATPKPNTVVFLSDPSVPGPQFQLIYELKEGSMAGKFQMHMPGQADWKSYLEWSGSKKK